MTPDYVIIDCETRSPVDLRKHGVDVYAAHPLTRVLNTAFYHPASGRREMFVAGPRPDPNDPLHRVPHPSALNLPFPVFVDRPPPLLDLVTSGRARPVAHNAPFEIANWPRLVREYGFPDIDPLVWVCTMALAASIGVPGKLDLTCKALRLPEQKDMAGHLAMLRLCKPRAARKDEDPTRMYWLDALEDHRTNALYAMQDAIAEAAVLRAIPTPPPQELRVIRTDRRVNLHGIGIDIRAAQGAAKIAAAETRRLDREMNKLTNGMITTVGQRDKILAWCRLQGVVLDDLRANTLRDALSSDSDEAQYDVLDGAVSGALGEMPAHVREVLKVRAEAAKASVTKIRAMLDRAGPDGRVRWALAYHGAYRTGRWAGRGIQPHNYARLSPPDTVEEAAWFDALASGDRDYFASFLPKGWSVMDGLKASQRGLLVPAPGRVFIAPDLSQIEARKLAWGARQEDKVAAFRRYDEVVRQYGKESKEAKAVDIYTITGTKMGMDRSSGKVGELACGYQAAHVTLMAFAHGMGITIPEEKAIAIVDAWRKANDRCVMLWYAEEEAALAAMQSPGRVIDRGHLGAYLFNPATGNLIRKMTCQYRCIVYRKARVENLMTRWGKPKPTITYESNFWSNETNSFARISTYGGKLVENWDQGSCRDILAEALVEMVEEYSIPIPLHVHDEAVAEVLEDRADDARKIMVECMTRPRAWAPGLPINSTAAILTRYRKD